MVGYVSILYAAESVFCRRVSVFRVNFIDAGPGIKADEMDKLFGKYQKLSARPTAGEDSTGLGLSIVKKYVDVMGGKVWCESEPGKGSSFIVSFRKS